MRMPEHMLKCQRSEDKLNMSSAGLVGCGRTKTLNLVFSAFFLILTLLQSLRPQIIKNCLISRISFGWTGRWGRCGGHDFPDQQKCTIR